MQRKYVYLTPNPPHAPSARGWVGGWGQVLFSLFKYIKITHGGLAQDHTSDLPCELNGLPLYTLRGLQSAILKDTLIIVGYTVIQSMTEG